MIYGLNFNGTQLPIERRAFPETVPMPAPRKGKMRIVGMTNDPDSVRQMIHVATNGKRILTTREARVKDVTWWAVFAA